jgi:FkbM family methyltransferase
MRLNTPGKLNRIGKSITPMLGNIAANPRISRFLEFSNAYLNCVLGKGAGAGWDKSEELAVSKFIHNANPVILDIGANRGEWTKELRRLIGDNGTWILVEPAPECCALLRTISSVVVMEVAVGERPGRSVLYSPGDASVLASLHQRQDSFVQGQAMNQREVTVVTIDGILDERGIDVADLVKMDLEGHELFALRGAEQSLRTHRIRALTFEFGSSNVNSRTYFRDFWELLTRNKYRIERIYPGGRTLPVTAYYEDLEYFRGATNYVAVANS